MSVMLADAGSTPAISTKYFKKSQSLRWLAFFYDMILKGFDTNKHLIYRRNMINTRGYEK